MTHERESAHADADSVVPSTRRSRRDGERDAALRALYADASETSTSVRVVDGSAPMYRTRREMRESASRLARDLPVIVETIDVPAAPPAMDAQAEPVEDAPAQPVAPATRRARRAATTTEPESIAQPADTISAQPVEAPSAQSAQAPAVPTRRERRLAALAATVAVASDEQAEPIAVADEIAAAPLVTAEMVAQRVAVEAVPADLVVEPTPAAADATPAPTSAPHVMTRAERRAAQAASSDEVSAAVAAVLGGEQADAASTPVRSPLRREAPRPPRPAVIARRPVQRTAVTTTPPRKVRSRAARSALQRVAAAGVIVCIGAFVTVTSLPAQAFSPAESESSNGAYGDVQVAQEFDVTDEVGAHGDEDVTAVLTRDDFGVDDALASARMTADEMAALQTVADSEEPNEVYDGEPSLPAVWSQLETSYTQSPFPSLAEVPVSSGFGYRWGSFHGGVDLVPGAGTPVYPVANGVVVGVWQGNHPGGGGYEVIVEHNIDGEFFQSWYPHMQAGSIDVRVGQVVDITTQLGAVGSTGHSTGPHLHLEIKNGDYISMDPLVWLATREQILEP